MKRGKKGGRKREGKEGETRGREKCESEKIENARSLKVCQKSSTLNHNLNLFSSCNLSLIIIIDVNYHN